MVTKEEIAAQPGKLRITFSVPASIWADCIELAGDFNHWNPAATPLHHAEDCWSVTLTLDRGRTYGFRYLVDHQEWMGDASADSYSIAPDGCVASMVIAQLPAERLSLRTAGPVMTPRREHAVMG